MIFLGGGKKYSLFLSYNILHRLGHMETVVQFCNKLYCQYKTWLYNSNSSQICMFIIVKNKK